MKSSLRITGTLITFALSAFLVFAQETPPADPPAPQEEPQEESPKPKFNRIELGVAFDSVKNNPNRFRQYGVPVRGLFIRELELIQPVSEKNPYARFRLGALSDDNVALAADGIFLNGRLALHVGQRRWEYSDPTPILIPRSESNILEASANYQAGRNVSVFGYASERRREQNFEPPKDGRVERVRNVVGSVTAKTQGGFLNVAIADHRMFSRDGSQPDAIRHRLEGTYERQFGPNLNVGGYYQWQQTEQRNRRNSTIKVFGLEGGWDIGSDTTLYFNLRNQRNESPIVENAFVRERFDTSLRLVHQLSNGSLQVGYRHREVERLREDQNYTDVPTWDKGEIRFGGRFGSGVRYGLKGSWEHLSKGAAIIGTDTRRLFWDDRVRGQAKLDYAGDRYALYGMYNYRFDQNSERDVEILNHQMTLGGSYQFSESASGFLELVSDTYRASGVVDETNVSLDEFFPSSVVLSGGFHWTLKNDSQAGLAFVRYFTRNANPYVLPEGNIRGTQVTATYTRTLSPSSSFSLALAPWSFRDKNYDQLGYRSTIFSVSYATRF